MLKKNLLISLMLLLVGLVVGWMILNLKTTTAETDEHSEHEEIPKAPKGPHGGCLLTDRDLQLEVRIYEDGIPPEFRIYAYRNLQPVPLSALKLTGKTVRLGQTDALTFKHERDYLVSQQTIYEPHSFDAIFEGVNQGNRYTWKFTQEEGRLNVPNELIQRSEIRLLKAGPRTLSKRLSFPGQIALDQDKYVHIVSPLEGIAQQVYKHVGERVTKGEILTFINSRELTELRLSRQLLMQKSKRAVFMYAREAAVWKNTRQLLQLLKQKQSPERIHHQLVKFPIGENKSVLLKAFSELRLAQQSYQREHKLQQDKVASQQDYQKAQTEYDKALSHYVAVLEETIWQGESNLGLRRQDVQTVKDEVQAIEQKLRVLNIPLDQSEKATARYAIRSPISGVITEKHLALGEAVQTERPIFVVADLAEVWAELQVPDAQLTQVHLGQHVRVTAQNGQRYAQGIISHNSPVVDVDSRRAEAHAHINNSDGFWRPGMFITVEVITDERTVPVAVAKSALQTYKDWTVVFARFGNQFEIRPLELGEEDSEWVEVKEGLKAGQTYAADNSFVLKAELGKKAATHDH